MKAELAKAMARRHFPGKASAGLRAEIRNRLTSSVDELWPMPLAERIRRMSVAFAFTASGKAALEALASEVAEIEQ